MRHDEGLDVGGVAFSPLAWIVLGNEASFGRRLCEVLPRVWMLGHSPVTPRTIGYAFVDSPVALCSWML
jgi:hypothetical protein